MSFERYSLVSLFSQGKHLAELMEEMRDKNREKHGEDNPIQFNLHR